MRGPETIEDDVSRSSSDAAVAGIVLVFSGGAPMVRALPLTRAPLIIARDDFAGSPIPDDRLSRAHAAITVDDARWTVRDLNSRNGTFLDGVQVNDTASATCGEAASVLRLAHSVFLLVPDVRPFLEADAVRNLDGYVVGPALQSALDRVVRAATAQETLLITGESGAGKELAARTFHAQAGRPGAPFVAVNCAAIPEGVAERLLFGAKKGAYSGAAADVAGYLESADGGTLFLDEFGELDQAVQAKLLRAIETREVLPLGAARGRRIDVRLVAATNRDLRKAVHSGRFRADLFFRLALGEVRIPALRERREEIPWLIAREVVRVASGLTAHGKLVEACCLRPWPGNVRELSGEIRRAAIDSAAAGEQVVPLERLAPTAGAALAEKTDSDAAAGSIPPATEITREAIQSALDLSRGNVSATARILGIHRTQLYRLLKKHGLGGSSQE
jgi:DNA-binding NtrC family response regulator